MQTFLNIIFAFTAIISVLGFVEIQILTNSYTKFTEKVKDSLEGLWRIINKANKLDN